MPKLFTPSPPTHTHITSCLRDFPPPTITLCLLDLVGLSSAGLGSGGGLLAFTSGLGCGGAAKAGTGSGAGAGAGEDGPLPPSLLSRGSDLSGCWTCWAAALATATTAG